MYGQFCTRDCGGTDCGEQSASNQLKKSFKKIKYPTMNKIKSNAMVCSKDQEEKAVKMLLSLLEQFSQVVRRGHDQGGGCRLES